MRFSALVGLSAFGLVAASTPASESNQSSGSAAATRESLVRRSGRYTSWLSDL
ncbi:MAG: hypothetical protein ACR2HZ_11780 [Gemmatimonadaceae bacterium]